jgi:hypothetical protein
MLFLFPETPRRKLKGVYQFFNNSKYNVPNNTSIVRQITSILNPYVLTILPGRFFLGAKKWAISFSRAATALLYILMELFVTS